MPEFTHPGVFVTEISGESHPIQAASTSTACFFGETLRGRPFAPTLVTSFTEFQRAFGGVVAAPGSSRQRDLPLAVQHFFVNGGTRLYVVRTLDPSDAATAAVGTLAGKIAVTAAGQGSWGNDLTVVLRQSVADPARVDILVQEPSSDPDGSAATLEELRSLGLDPGQPDFYAHRIHRDSKLIRIVPAPGEADVFEGEVSDLDLADVGARREASVQLTGGSDGDPGQALSLASMQAATASIEGNEAISILAAPGVTDPALVDHLAGYVDGFERRDLFLVLDGPGDQHNRNGDGYPADEALRFKQAISPQTSYAALYWPWLEVADPYAQDPRATRFAPPSGFIAGLFARTDNQRGVWKAPAGTSAGLHGAVGLAKRVTDAEQDNLNPAGVNAIRRFPASGIVCWGGRTLASQDPEFRYVPVRRTAIFLRTSLDRGTRWVVFEPNDEALWAKVRSSVASFLSMLFRAGAFQGATSREAYLVLCDSTNNYQATIDAGQVHIRVGFAPVKPAEFVLIAIQQMRADS